MAILKEVREKQVRNFGPYKIIIRGSDKSDVFCMTRGMTLAFTLFLLLFHNSTLFFFFVFVITTCIIVNWI